MDNKILPLNKYENESVTKMINEQHYWFKNNGPTPEHNSLQNKFLDREFLLDVINNLFSSTFCKIKQLFDSAEFKLCFKIQSPRLEHSIEKSDVKFEEKFNWDVIIYHRNVQKMGLIADQKYESEFKEKYKKEYEQELKKHYDLIMNKYEAKKGACLGEIIDVDYCKVLEKYGWAYWMGCEFLRKEHEKIYLDYFKRNYNASMENFYKNLFIDIPISIQIEDDRTVIELDIGIDVNIFCELQTQLGEDYPLILRKMKYQMELTVKNKDIFSCKKFKSVLIIGKLNLISTTREELIIIFKQSNITILFMNDILNKNFCDQNIDVNPIKDNKIKKIQDMDELITHYDNENFDLKQEIEMHKKINNIIRNDYYDLQKENNFLKQKITEFENNNKSNKPNNNSFIDDILLINYNIVKLSKYEQIQKLLESYGINVNKLVTDHKNGTKISFGNKLEITKLLILLLKNNKLFEQLIYMVKNYIKIIPKIKVTQNHIHLTSRI